MLHIIDDLLPPPRIPASDDGVIDATDLASNEIYAIIGYSGMKNGDFVKLYVDNEEAGETYATDQNIEIPVIISIPISILTDGTHVVTYDASDIVGNKLNSRPLNIYVDSQNNIDKLPHPTIIDGEDGCLSLSEIEDRDGAIIFIAPSIKYNEYINNTLYLSWAEYDEKGMPIPDGIIEWSMIIDENFIENGHRENVDKDIVLLAINGGAFAYYYIETGAERVYSTQSRVQIGNCDNTNDKISLISDKYYVLDNDIDFATLTANIVDNNGSPVADKKISWVSSINELEYSATITDSNGMSQNTLKGLTDGDATVMAVINTGDDASVKIVFGKNNPQLPAPIFTQASNDIISSTTIEDDNKVNIRVSYDTMQIDDIVHLVVDGKFSDGIDDPQAHVELNHTLVSMDIANRRYDFALPASNALSVQNNGTLEAMYTVNNSQGEQSSESAEVTISIDDSRSISYWVTTGAPVYDHSILQISPHNQVKLYGLPGALIILSCTDGGIFLNSGTKEDQIYLDHNGIAFFDIASTTAKAVTLNGYQEDAPEVSFTTTLDFRDYTAATSPFYAFARTTGALADGQMYCSLYIITEPDSSLKHVRVLVQSPDAEIIGYSNPAIIPLNTDNSVAVDIRCTSPGGITAEVTLPESSGNHINIDIAFTNEISTKPLPYEV